MTVASRSVGIVAGAFLVVLAGAAIAARAVKERLVPMDDPAEDEVRLAAIFAPLSFRGTSQRFRGGTLDCWFGGGVVDLRDAELDPAGAHLAVRGIFGGGQIVVPESWRVTTSVTGLGGIGDNRSKAERPADAPELTIEGFALFGGFGVTSELPEAQARGLEEAVARYNERRGTKAPEADLP